MTRSLYYASTFKHKFSTYISSGKPSKKNGKSKKKITISIRFTFAFTIVYNDYTNNKISHDIAWKMKIEQCKRNTYIEYNKLRRDLHTNVKFVLYDNWFYIAFYYCFFVIYLCHSIHVKWYKIYLIRNGNMVWYIYIIIIVIIMYSIIDIIIIFVVSLSQLHFLCYSFDQPFINNKIIILYSNTIQLLMFAFFILFFL